MRVCLDICTELQKAISLRAVTNKYLAFVSARQASSSEHLRSAIAGACIFKWTTLCCGWCT